MISRLPSRRIVRGFIAAALLWTLVDAHTVLAESPQVLFKELFTAVQAARIFPDGKTFADAVPHEPPSRILEEYHRQRPRATVELKEFVTSHFDLPSDTAATPSVTAPLDVPLERVSIVAHIDALWPRLTRTTTAVPPYSSLLTLPHAYVVPGGRFRELYYWDSYFTMLGLMRSGRRDLAEDMVRDFGYLIDTFGHVPNGARSYYLSRSQPPFFFKMVALLGDADPAAEFALYLPQLQREYAFWMRGAEGLKSGSARYRVVALDDGAILNRYWDDRNTPRDESYLEDTQLARSSRRDPRKLYRDIRAAAESGWDFSSRWFADAHHLGTIDTTEIVPVDLNSLLFGLEHAISAGCLQAGNVDCARDFGRRAARRRSAIDRYLWDADAGAYQDFRFTRGQRIPRLSAATLYPLFVGLASASQAESVGQATREQLLKGGGVVTTPLDTGQQWDSPNGWAPIQWIAVDGLRRYHLSTLAAAIACRWMGGVNRLYRDSGKLVEKYDVVDTGRLGGGGEYATQDGFGWTNGVMLELIALYPVESRYDSAATCPAERATAGSPNVK